MPGKRLRLAIGSDIAAIYLLCPGHPEFRVPGFAETVDILGKTVNDWMAIERREIGSVSSLHYKRGVRLMSRVACGLFIAIAFIALRTALGAQERTPSTVEFHLE